MQSNLTLAEFRNRLTNFTKIGHPKLKLSPFAVFSMFGDSSKTFYGLFDDNTFSLTSNFRTDPTYYILRGSYKTVNGKLEVQYELAPRHKYQLYWWIFIPVLGFVVFNSILLSTYNESISELPLIINMFLIFMVTYAYININTKRKKLEKNFMKIFEIT
ncbi:MAG: hypothetical protein H7239_05910 [Flavobacterium sp.]|nr:hypothetical protein [Flavobacterium sp.]